MDNVIEKLGYPGAMISASKSGYMERNPKNLAVFNSNLIAVSEEKQLSLFSKPVAEKIWYGDIDITKSREKLKELSAELGKTLLVLYEMDARFENESRPQISNFVYKVTPQGEEEIGKRLKEYFIINESIIEKNEH